MRIEHVAADGAVTVLKKGLKLQAAEILDSSVMHVGPLRAFFAAQIEDAQAQGVLLSLHLKATMMKVSDPVIFGHAVTVFFKEVFADHAETFARLGVNPANGLGDVYAKIQALPADEKAKIEADIQATYARRPALAMVDSDKGITNLHVPNDVIVDASMPVVVRDSGGMWGPDGKLHDTKAVMDKLKSTPIDDGLFKGNIQVNGKFSHDFYVFEVKKPNESKGPWDYYKLVATIPAAEASAPLDKSCKLVK